ncbi:hypothetical protein BGX30_000198, partial [Mortierella sp. GBA39]
MPEFSKSLVPAIGSVSDTLTCENRDPATSMPLVPKARNIHKGQDDLDDDIDKSAALRELEEIAEWTPTQSSPFYEVARYIYDKVHGKLRVMVDGAWSGEVAIFDSKPVVSDATCERQHNKSIRLNSAILNNLESHGLDICRWYPIIAETRAASADFYTIKKLLEIRNYGGALGLSPASPALRERGHGGSLGKSTISVSRDATVAADPYHA